MNNGAAPLRRLSRLGRARSLATLLALLLSVATAACEGPSPSPSGSPSRSPGASQTSDGSSIDHLSGPADVVFRFEQGGGFVPLDFFATQAPQFTLYGDGTVIFRDNSLPVPPRANPNIASLAPFQTARLDEAAVQAFLRFAAAEAGWGWQGRPIER